MSIVSVNLEKLSESARAEVLRSMEKVDVKVANTLKGVKDGETFTVAGIEFIKFPAVGGKTPVVAKNCLFCSRFGTNNDIRQSPIIEKLEADVLPKIIAAIGEENVCTIKTDLTTLDGLKPYGVMESKVSLPTFDFYRANVEIFDQHKVNEWWWTATPESAKPHDDLNWAVCVSPSGYIYIGICNDDSGVRPFFLFESSIFGSSKE